MKSLLLAASATLPLLTGFPAQAADMPVKNPTYNAPVPYSWTGFYFGGHLGAGWANSDWRPLGVPNVARFGAGSSPGFLGGAQVGVNRQVDAMVFGVEADVNWAAQSSEACNLQAVILCNSRADRFGTITGRFGIAADRALVYFKGGAARLHSTQVITVNSLEVTASGNKWGWTAGAGVEYALTRNWSAKLEYDFIDFGTSPFSFSGLVVDIKQSIQTVKVGLNYKLDWGGPFAASY